MATDDRKRIKCGACKLVQFVNTPKTCLRCKQSLVLGKLPGPIESKASLPQIEIPEGTPMPVAGVAIKTIGFWVPMVLAGLRAVAGVTQLELSERMGVCRTYITKIESGRVCPNLGSLPRYVKALGTDVFTVIQMAEVLTFGPAI